jgi:hypothetical protein
VLVFRCFLPPRHAVTQPVEVENYQRLHLDKRRVGTKHKSRGAGSKPKGAWRKDQRVASERAAEGVAAALGHSGEGAFASTSHGGGGGGGAARALAHAAKAAHAGAALVAAKEADRSAWQRARETRAAGAGVDALDLCLDAWQQILPSELLPASAPATSEGSSSSGSSSSSSSSSSLLSLDAAADAEWAALDVDAIAEASLAAAAAKRTDATPTSGPRTQTSAADAVRAAAKAQKLRTALVLADAARVAGGSNGHGNTCASSFGQQIPCALFEVV